MGVRAAPEKTKYMVDTGQRIQVTKYYAAQPNLDLAGQRIQPSPLLNILGITIEGNGKAEAWLLGALKRCNSLLDTIRRICNARGGGTPDVAKRTVKVLLAFQVFYGARHVWLAARQ